MLQSFPVAAGGDRSVLLNWIKTNHFFLQSWWLQIFPVYAWGDRSVLLNFKMNSIPFNVSIIEFFLNLSILLQSFPVEAGSDRSVL